MENCTLSNFMHHGVVSSMNKSPVVASTCVVLCSQCLLALLCSGHCKKLAPAWSELGKSFENDSDVVIAHVDCTQTSKVCSKAKVSRNCQTSLLAEDLQQPPMGCWLLAGHRVPHTQTVLQRRGARRLQRWARLAHMSQCIY